MAFCFTFSQDELQTDVNNLQDDIRFDPTGVKELQTKLMEVESRLEAYKAITDAEFRDHLSKLTQLETRINEIESDSSVATGNIQTFKAIIFSAFKYLDVLILIKVVTQMIISYEIY